MTLRQRIEHWFASRSTPRDSVQLTQRNIYIIPTRPGLMLAVTLLVLLLTSINYQLNLGYALTFLLAGSALVGMHVCHRTLRGLQLSVQAPEPVFAGQAAQLHIRLSNPQTYERYGIGLAVRGLDAWSWTDVPASGHSTVELRVATSRRGQQPIAPLTAETRYPLGTFRAWTVWRVASTLLVYPQPEASPPPLPSGAPGGPETAGRQSRREGEYDGIRLYQRGDPLKQIMWKKTAQTGQLVSRDSSQRASASLWLDLAQLRQTMPGHTEQHLSRLCAWVLQAEQQDLRYGLRLGGLEITPDQGAAHCQACLKALALYQGT